MNTEIYNMNNEKVGNIELPEAIFNAPWRPVLVQQVLLAQMANARRPWAHAKGRGEVSGGGKKPWKQKGTGRARHGSIRSPLWRGGGKAHGPSKERDYSQKVNKKMKQQALASVLSKKLKDEQVKILDAFNLAEPKTKFAAAALIKLREMKPRAKKFDVLIIRDVENKTLTRAARNLEKTRVLSPESLNVYDLMNYKYVIFEKGAIQSLKK